MYLYFMVFLFALATQAFSTETSERPFFRGPGDLFPPAFQNTVEQSLEEYKQASLYIHFVPSLQQEESIKQVAKEFLEGLPKEQPAGILLIDLKGRQIRFDLNSALMGRWPPQRRGEILNRITPLLQEKDYQQAVLAVLEFLDGNPSTAAGIKASTFNWVWMGIGLALGLISLPFLGREKKREFRPLWEQENNKREVVAVVVDRCGSYPMAYVRCGLLAVLTTTSLIPFFPLCQIVAFWGGHFLCRKNFLKKLFSTSEERKRQVRLCAWETFQQKQKAVLLIALWEKKIESTVPFRPKQIKKIFQAIKKEGPQAGVELAFQSLDESAD